ncbi:MAG: alpha/beta hydrolase domain-containing protein [Acidimicrobiia bacterium]
MYRDHDDYVDRFNRRLDELLAQGWLLADDADELRGEATKAQVP